MPNISVIVPVYNVQAYLSMFIENILKQTHENFELILINDGSQDNCDIICEKYKKKDKRIKVIHQKNKGSGIARNSGLAMARGKYIYFCDPDDYIEKNLLKDNFQLAEKYQANMVIFGYNDLIITKRKTRTIPNAPKSRFLETQTHFREEFQFLHKQNLMFTLWNKLYKKEFIDDYNYWFENQKVGQDTVFNYKVYHELNRVYLNEKIYYHYVITRPDSAVNMYRENRFELRRIGSKKLEELIDYWNYSEVLDEVILIDWFKTLYVGLNNLFFAKSPLTNKEKKERIHYMMTDPKIEHMIYKISKNNIPSMFMKIIIFLLKKKKIEIVMFLFKIKFLIKIK